MAQNLVKKFNGEYQNKDAEILFCETELVLKVGNENKHEIPYTTIDELNEEGEENDGKYEIVFEKEIGKFEGVKFQVDDTLNEFRFLLQEASAKPEQFLARRLKNRKKIISDLVTEVSGRDEKLYKIQQELKFQKISELKKEIKRLEATVTDTEEKNKSLETAYSELLTQLLNNTEQYKEAFNDLKQEKKDALKKLSDSMSTHFNEELENNKKKMNLLKNEVGKLEEEKNNKQQMIDQFKHKYQEMRNKQDQLKTELQDKERRIAKLQKLLEKEKNKDSDQFKLFEKEKEKLENETSEMKNELKQIDEDLSKQEDYHKLIQELKEMEKEIESKKKELEKEKTQMDKMSTIFSCLQQESLYYVAKTEIRNVPSVIFKHATYETEKGRARIAREIKETNFFTKLENNKYFCQIFGSVEFEDEKKFTLVLEKCDIDLFKYIKKNKLTLSEKLDLLKQVAEGMKIMHENNKVHLDLKPQNIFLKKEGDKMIIKIADFEEVQSTEEEFIFPQEIGTFNFMDYRIINLISDEIPDTHLKERDIYSFGVLMFCVILRKIPFKPFMRKMKKRDFDFKQLDLPRSIRDYLYDSPDESSYDLLLEGVSTKDVPEQLLQIIDACMGVEKNRPSFEKLVKYLEDYEKVQITKETEEKQEPPKEVKVEDEHKEELDELKKQLEKKDETMEKLRNKMKKITEVFKKSKKKLKEFKMEITEKEEKINGLQQVINDLEDGNNEEIEKGKEAIEIVIQKDVRIKELENLLEAKAEQIKQKEEILGNLETKVKGSGNLVKKIVFQTNEITRLGAALEKSKLETIEKTKIIKKLEAQIKYLPAQPLSVTKIPDKILSKEELILNLELTRKELSKVKRKDLNEIISYRKPPKVVNAVVRTFFILLGKEANDWNDCRSLLKDNKIKKEIIEFDVDKLKKLSKDTLKAISKNLKKVNRKEVENSSKIVVILYKFLLFSASMMAKSKKKETKAKTARTPSVEIN